MEHYSNAPWQRVEFQNFRSWSLRNWLSIDLQGLSANESCLRVFELISVGRMKPVHNGYQFSKPISTLILSRGQVPPE